MAAKMIIGGEELEMPMWLKGRLLAQTVETTNDPDVFTCESGTSNKRYRVVTDGLHTLSCSCPAVGNCAHRIAVEKYVSEQAGEMEAVAMAIIEQEKAAKEQAQRKPLPRINTSKYGLTNTNYRPHQEACTCGAGDWQEHYKMEFEAYVAKQAVKEAECHLAEQRKIEAFSFMK